MQIRIGEYQVRSFRYDDAEALAGYANNRRVWINLRDRFPHPYTRGDAEAWIDHGLRETPETSFAIASDKEVIGDVGLQLQGDIHRRSAEVGYWLGEPFWGRGIATEALRAVTDYAFANFELIRLYAGVLAWNPASCRVLEKAGYTCEGRLRANVTKDGKTIDEWLYAIVRE
jgi:RimJ/RimL family protein N-acetyltransferase